MKSKGSGTGTVQGASVAPPLRAAIVGAGFMGEVHARSIRLNGSTLVAVDAGEPDKGPTAADRLGAQSYATLDEIVERNDVDVVHLCTPNHLHAPMARRVLAAGKHVVCEKPLATSAEDAADLAGLAEAAGVIAVVPFVYRYYPSVQEARARVQGGQVGELRLVHGSYLQDWLLNAADDNWRVDDVRGGPSRAFADIGVHWCDLMEHVTNQRITSVMARLTTAVASRGRSGASRENVRTEDIALVMFVTDRGVSGSLVVSQVSAGRKNRLWLSVDGSEQSLAFDQELPDTLWLGTAQDVRLLPRSPVMGSAAARGLSRLPAGHPQGYQDCFDSFINEAYAAIAGRDADVLPTFRDGSRAAAITDAVLRSHCTQAWSLVEECSAITSPATPGRLS